MKRCLLSAVLMCTLFSAKAQDSALIKKELAFTAACQAVVQNFYKKDVKKLNAMISPKYGIYVTFRPGAIDTYRNDPSLDPEDRRLFEDNAIAKPDFNRTPLQFSKMPVFDCDKYRWNKTGFFADSSKKYKPVSSIAEFRIKYEEDTASKHELIRMRYVERNSRKVVMAGGGKNKTGIIFYLTWINNRWWLSIIDLVTMDCSA